MRLIAAFLILVCSFAAAAQTTDTATLQGTVTDQTNAAVPHAAVTVENALTGLHREATADTNGYFVVAGLPVAGAYKVTVTGPGFAAAEVDHVVLAAGSAAQVSVRLNVAVASANVIVTGAANDVRIDQPQLGIRLSEQQIEETPLYSRRITYLPLLSAANRPAINQGDVFMNEDLFTTNGAGRRQTWFEIDGSTGNDSWGRQTLFTNVPQMAVDEMSVLTNAFTAQYGGGTGSVVNIVTRSGGNSLHGQVLELWRPSGPEASLSGFTTANASSGNDLTNDALGQTAASIGGAFGKDQLNHFFLAGEFNRQDRASPVISPLDPGPYIGHYRGWLGFLRLDRQFNAHNNGFLRVNMDHFYDTNPNGIVGGNSLPNVARIFRRYTYAGELGETSVLTPHMVNNARLQFQLASPITEFDPVVFSTQFVVPITSSCGSTACGTFTSGTSQSALLMNRQYVANETLAIAYGHHDITFGGSVIDAHTGGNSKEFGGPIYLGSFTYFPCPQPVSVCESSDYLNSIANVQSYQQSYGNANYTVDDQLWALFAQDDYRVSHRLTLNAGLRYERQTFTDAALSFAPRVGFVFDMTGSGSLVARGGFGIYYSQIVDNEEASYALGGPQGVFNYTATPGQAGFPAAVSDAPLPAFPAGANAPVRSLYVRPGDSKYLDTFFPTSALNGYPDQLLNPYSEQWTLGIEHRFATQWLLSIDYVGTHTLRIVRPLDVDSPSYFARTEPGQVRTAQAANCTRPYWIYWYQQNGATCNTAKATNPQPPYSVIQTDVNDGYLHYDALDVNLSHAFSKRFEMLTSYTWSHTLDNVDPDTTSQNPNDANVTGEAEYGNAIYDQRHRFVLSGLYVAPLKVHIGGVTTLASGLPYNLTTGVVNNGDTGATTARPVINGAVVGRDTGRGNPIYSVGPFVSRSFPLYRDLVHLDLRAEASNVLNHANFVGYNGTYGNGATRAAGFGQPLVGIINQLPARELQFSAKFLF
ncbi:carboxypeptidase regulatory-like domain-containing protein [Acidicapsa dinghuensis]|uniref:Carboxypeptidase regulatory-like domain-containing protein n=1 Tax=Acidicapsa dinghuensis TaxID=2218256 RepID=A0ABW1EN96_9BACT|nr:carboxypeptidase regulatory-like domain-containing protein [Acidicapsa dinghuensis]